MSRNRKNQTRAFSAQEIASIKNGAYGFNLSLKGTMKLLNVQSALEEDWKRVYKDQIDKPCPGCHIIELYGSANDMKEHMLDHVQKEQKGSLWHELQKLL